MCVAMPRRDAMGGSSRSGKVHDDGREPAQPVPVLWSKEQKVLIDKLIGDAFSRSNRHHSEKLYAILIQNISQLIAIAWKRIF